MDPWADVVFHIVADRISRAPEGRNVIAQAGRPGSRGPEYPAAPEGRNVIAQAGRPGSRGPLGRRCISNCCRSNIRSPGGAKCNSPGRQAWVTWTRISAAPEGRNVIAQAGRPGSHGPLGRRCISNCCRSNIRSPGGAKCNSPGRQAWVTWTRISAAPEGRQPFSPGLRSRKVHDFVLHFARQPCIRFA
jgi:hypothetical protein